ncbi:MAG: zinc-dependent metalloprotease [Thermomicrobiales bacterium]|nr:zinc-dependent metalloprotease [Thermomicrobiales bacterium]
MEQQSRRKTSTLAAGAAVGIAIGAWSMRKVADFANKPRTSSLIDWDHAREIATRMNVEGALTATERESLNAYYDDLVQKCIPIIESYTGVVLPPADERTFAFDRVDWINANLEGFQRMFAPIEAMQEEKIRTSTISRAFSGVNQSLMSYEVGTLLGYMARRVMGQYDLAMFGREPVADPGKLYFVEPNIRGIERKLGMPKEDFRMWLALHETTHVFEFEAHPWVRQHFNALLERYMQFLQQDTEFLKQGMRGLKVFANRIRNSSDEETQANSWMEALMDQDQRTLFNEMQAMMSVIEGYSNHVMNAVGKDLLPRYDEISRKFEERQAMRSQADILFGKLTGLNVKLEQYRQGEEFIDAVVEKRGHAFAYRVWDKPEHLPTMAELKDPDIWIHRIETLTTA